MTAPTAGHTAPSPASGPGIAPSGAPPAELLQGAEAEELAVLEERMAELDGDAAALRRYVAPLGDLGDCESGDRERQRSEAGSERPRCA